ncbi:MAG: hypothetical protein J0I86_12940 [Mesorhizobium sp.]|nr:hypothetical protein [Mesorhizobium sp.]
MANRQDKKGRSASGGEHWTKLIRTTMEEPAYSALSTAAQALYPWLKLEWHGPDANNNGKIRLSVRQAACRLGIAPNTAAEAFHDLQRKGFIVQTEGASLGIEGAARAPAYEITELRLPLAKKGQDGRKLYREWRPGNDFPVQTTAPNNPGGIHGKKTKPCLKNQDGTVLKIETNDHSPVLKTDTACLKNEDENATLAGEAVSKTKTSLSYHTPSHKNGQGVEGRAGARRPTKQASASGPIAQDLEAIGSFSSALLNSRLVKSGGR